MARRALYIIYMSKGVFSSQGDGLISVVSHFLKACARAVRIACINVLRCQCRFILRADE